MKKTLLFIGFVLMCTLIKAQDAHYYYYDGKKQYLTLNTEYAFLSLEEASISDSINQLAVDIKDIRSDNTANKQYRSKQGKNRFCTELKFQGNLTKEQYLAKIADIKRLHSKAIVSPYFKMGNDDKIGLSNFFYVKLKSESDTVLLEKMAMQKKCTIIEQDQFMPLWFVLSTTELSEFNAMEMANIFYESGHFTTAEPNLMPSKLLATNDTYYSNQWGLLNTGQYGGTSGIDINIVNAWSISKGNNIKVAIIDEGIDLTHPDLAGNIHSQSYDTQNRTSPSVIRGSHGTACAGIAGAIQNNNEGISGVAPNCKLISISRQLTNISSLEMINVQQDLAAGINWARQNGADVISNSWGSDALQGSYITDAINNAVTQGRNGKGCVMVFASGNDFSSSVSYPASLSNVIAVGAIDNNGQRASFSNYGTELDVVAPGVEIYTTDIQGSAGYNTSSGTAGDYYANFTGTSAACPHVAGIAALILSVNPSLTQAQVRQIIGSTCQKVGGYTYSNNVIIRLIHPYGTWDQEMGYGLVDAYTAVQAAVNTVAISGPEIISCTGAATYTSNVSGTWIVSSNLQIVSGQGTNSITVQKISSNTTVVRYATVSINNKTKNILIGSPKVTSIDGPGVAGGGLYYFSPNPFYPAATYSASWLIYATDGSGTANFTITQNINNYLGVRFTKPGTYMILCAYSNACATSSEMPVYKTLTVTQNDLMSMSSSSSLWSSAYPNPASNELIIDKTEEENGIEISALNTLTVKAKTSEMRVLLYSHSTAKAVYNKTYQSSEKQIRIDVSKLTNGVYYLNIIENGEKIKEQTIIVNH
ncbi:MAG: S8 family serine peptidase [Prevotellaceae bacterium]|jgi:subtilisin family serine protease|nr:S8 family serine peptidase [Prevotellaceae bacterium]